MYTERTFTIPALDGITPESVAAHLGLYAGYVKNTNTLLAAQDEMLQDPQKNMLALAETSRRLPFEFNGVRLHELYFEQWENGAQPLAADSTLAAALAKQFGSVEAWEARFKAVGSMRGVGWAVLYWDKAVGEFRHTWVDQHHQGLLAELPVILILDIWEHAYLSQFGTAGRATYIETWFKNLNWSASEKRFTSSLT